MKSKKNKTVIIRTEASSCEDFGKLEGLSAIEVHQKMIDDEPFLYEVAQHITGISDADWKELPEEIREELAMKVKGHAAEFLVKHKHPKFYRFTQFMLNAYISLKSTAVILGFVTLMFVFFYGVLFYSNLLLSFITK